MQILRLALLFLASASAVSLSHGQEPPDQISLTIQLKEGRWYSAQELRDECRRKMGTSPAGLTQPDRLLELTRLERAMLLLAKEAGLLDVRFEQDRLTLFLPDAEDERVRQANLHRLERLFGIPLDEWPEGTGLHVPDQFDPTARTMLLVHGLGSSVDDMERLTTACRAAGFQTLTFDYPNDGPLAQSGERLRDELQAFVKQYPTARLAIIAHSMGGLVVRYSLEMSDVKLDCVTDVFFLGTPQQGSTVARMSYVLQPFYEPLFGKDALVRSLRSGLGEARDDLLPDSRFLRGLADNQRLAGVRYHVGLGTKSFVTAEQYAVISEEVRRRLAHPNLAPALRMQLQQVIDAAELKPGQGDGAVSVASARLADATSERAFELNHLELKDLPDKHPENSAVFQWILKTLE